MENFPTRLLIDEIQTQLPTFIKERIEGDSFELSNPSGAALTVGLVGTGKSQTPYMKSIIVKCVCLGKEWIQELYSRGDVKPFAKKIHDNVAAAGLLKF